MAEYSLKAEERTVSGKNANRRLRAEGKIPAVIYGQGKEALSLTIDPKELSKILHSESGRNTIFNIEVKGESKNVLVRDFQLDPLKGSLIHADLQTVVMDQAMEFEVPVTTTGVSIGVKNDGGILDIVTREILVECLPSHVPDHIVVDITELDLNDSVRVEDLDVDPEVKILTEPGRVVMSVVPPRVVEEEVEEVEEEVEPELIRKGKEDEEESGGEE